jgi:hypothetical protein
MASGDEEVTSDHTDLEAQELAALESFAARIDELDAELNPTERAALHVLLYRAMSPLERIRHRAATGRLDADEQAMLDALAAEDDAGAEA